jgi:hypothetical protein
MLRPGPAPGLAELADDVVVVAVAEDARLVRLTIDDASTTMARCSSDHVIALLLVAPLTGPFHLCRQYRHRGDWRRRRRPAARRPDPQAQPRQHPWVRHRWIGAGLLIAIGGYRRQRCPPIAFTLVP